MMKLLLGMLILAFGSEEIKSEVLFTIERNKNANVVVYEALVKNGAIYDDEPIRAYWHIPSGKEKREDLSFFEKRMAYGWDVEKIEKRDAYKFYINACSERTIIIEIVSGIPRASMMIDGKRSYLQKIYIFVDESKVIPEVQYVDIIGVTVYEGNQVKERMKP